MNISKVLLFLITIFTLLIFINPTLSTITEPIRDGDYIYIDDSKAYLKGTYSVTHGEDIEHWAMTKQFTGDCDMAIGFDGVVAWPTKVLLEDPHYEYWDTNTSKTFYYVTNFASTTDAQDYGNWYNLLKYKFDHKIFIGYDNATNESVWQDVIGTVAYFDSQTNDGTNYTITWHTEHSRLERYRDISNRILANPIEYEFDGMNLWFVTKDISMTAGEMRKIVIEMDGKIELGEQSYKYDIIWKPSYQTIAEAKAAGNLYVLDPYWNSSWSAYSTITMNATAPENDFQILISSDNYNMSQAQWDEMNQDGNDTRILNYNHTISFPLWIETLNSRTDFKVWVNVTNNDFATYQWYFGNPSASSASDGDNTFIGFDNIADGNTTNGPLISTTTNFASATYAKSGGYSAKYTEADGLYISTAVWPSVLSLDDHIISFWIYFTATAGRRATVFCYDSGGVNRGIYLKFENGIVYRYASGAYANTGMTFSSGWNQVEWIPGATITLMRMNGGSWVNVNNVDTLSDFKHITQVSSPDLDLDYFDEYLARKYIANEPIVTDISEPHFHTDSLRHNATSPYNHTIESDGTLTSNRSIITADDTNDTASSTGTTYLIVTQFNNSLSIVRNFTLTGDDLDWYQAANLSGSYSMKNSSGTVQTVNNGNFTDNLVAGDYWVESEGIVITRTSQTPTYLYENTTGTFQVIWDVEHNSVGLDHLRIYHMWNQYDYGIDCYCNSIRFPSNNKASNFTPTGEYILRQDNRNGTALFENDTRVTEGNIWKWGGLDKNSARMNIVEIDSTNTRIYINGTVQDMVLPNSWPLNRIELEDATKTAYSIYINHPIIIKWYDIEAAKGNTNYIVSPYFDTELNGLTPTFPIEIYYHNGSFDPLGAVDIEDSPDLVYVTAITGTNWINWTYSPRPNADYINGVYLNSSAIVNAGVTPDKDSFWYLKSQTSPSRAYDIMLANSATSTNRSFAQTDSVWIGNTAPYTAHPYTASSFTSFSKGEHQINYRLFVTDNNSVNATSVNYTSNISASIFPPSTPTINHFHFLGETDYDMDGVYYGNFSIGCGVSSDPDGGDVTHNLTLHYANNLTLVTIINNTFTDKDITHNGVYFDANFSSIPYYSDDVNYTLRLIATDDESESVTVWLNKNFTLSITPIITSYTPSTPVTTIQHNPQEFTINISQIVNVTWYIDGSVVSTVNNTNYSTYSNSTAPIDIYNVTAHVENVNGTRQQVWEWNVEDPIYSALIQLQADIDDMKKVQTIIQALILLVIGVVVGVVSQRRRYNDEDSEKPIESKNN